MPRIKLSERPAYPFSALLQVRVDDINYGGPLDNARFAALLHETRVRYLKELGATEADLGDGKTGIVMADLVLNYKAEVFHGAELVIRCDIDEMEARGFRMFYRVENRGELAALAETGIVCFDYSKRAPARIPECFVERVRRYEQEANDRRIRKAP